MRHISPQPPLGLAVCAALLLMAPSAAAQTEAAEADDDRIVDTIVVTATHRTTTLQDTAQTISVVTAAQLENYNIHDISRIAGALPGVDIQNEASTTVGVTLRGVTTSSFGVYRETLNVGTYIASYIDDTPFDIGVVPIKLVDLNRIEVLMGPQGALFGKSTLGGAIRYITNDPVMGEFSGKIDAGISTISQSDDMGNEITGVLNVPLGETMALRLVGYQYNQAGYMDIEGHYYEDDANSEDTSGIRAKFRWNVTDNVKLDVMYLNQDLLVASRETAFGTFGERRLLWPSSGAGFLPVNPDDLSQQFKEALTSEEDVWAAKLSVAFESFDVDLIYGYKEHFHDRFTEDLGQWGGHGGLSDLGNAADSPSHEMTFKETGTIELRFLSTFTDSRFDWMAGFYKENRDHLRDELAHARIPVPGDTLTLSWLTYSVDGELMFQDNRTNDYEETSVYGELGYRINDRTRVSGGMRFANIVAERLNLNPTTGAVNQAEISEDEGVDTYKFVIEHDYTDDVLLYGMAASGFRSGGVNLANAIVTGGTVIGRPEDIPYKSDNIWNYEGGVKATLMDGRMTLNASLFRILWSDLQLNIREPASDTNITGNIGKATITGVDIQGRWIVNDNWGMAFNLGLKNPIAAEDFEGPGYAIEDGDDLPGSSKINASAYFDYSNPISANVELDAHLGLRWSGESNVGPLVRRPQGSRTIEPYTIADASVGLRSVGSWSAALFVNNLFDNVHMINRGEQNGQQPIVNFTRPRLVAVKFGYRF